MADADIWVLLIDNFYSGLEGLLLVIELPICFFTNSEIKKEKEVMLNVTA